MSSVDDLGWTTMVCDSEILRLRNKSHALVIKE